MSVLIPLLIAGLLADLGTRVRPRRQRPGAPKGFVPLAAAALIGQLMMPGLGGAAVALGVALLLWRRERAQVSAPELMSWAPVAAELLAACLTAGLAQRQALESLAGAAPESAGEPLRRVVAALRLGADQRTAWGELAADPAWQGISASFIRSAETGAPLARLLQDWAGQRRADALANARADVRTAGVKAVLPIGLCFLPAFVLTAVVPLVAGLLGSVSTFGR